MDWTNDKIAALVEPDRAHRKAYVDEDLFDLEMERIFERLWVYIGHESQVKNPGDYYLARVGRQPMMMTRDHNGEIHVLYNRCPHRGAQLCTARKGNAGRRIRCSYHAWFFDLDNGIRVKIGRYAFDERLDRFLKFIPTLIPDRINEIESIDLRYTNGLSVLWKNNFNISSN